MGSIIVSNLGKAYKTYPTRWSRLREWITAGNRQFHNSKWVLQNINFTVRPGESVGIIGTNGAGKSTLLKMITGTAQPTTGGVQLSGRVAALLELGMGFHPDFTGRQNVCMAGQLLGFSTQEIERLMPEIEAFAEIGEYIDQPVRVYSSGMQVRLAFSVATAVRPDILIVDEALSVGDILFQQKCMARIRSFQELGTTLLFVTHDTAALYAICDRVIVLGKGRCLYQGETKKAVEIYLEILGAEKSVGPTRPTNDAILQAVQELEREPVKARTGLFPDIDTFISAIDFIDLQGRVLQTVVEGEPFAIRFVLQGLNDYHDPHVGFRIQDRLGLVIFETNTYCQRFSLGAALSGRLGSIVLIIKCANNLAQGEYSLAVGIEQEGYGLGAFKNVICPTKVVKTFTVVRDAQATLWAGVSNLRPEFFCKETQRLSDTAMTCERHAK